MANVKMSLLCRINQSITKLKIATLMLVMILGIACHLSLAAPLKKHHVEAKKHPKIKTLHNNFSHLKSKPKHKTTAKKKSRILSKSNKQAKKITAHSKKIIRSKKQNLHKQKIHRPTISPQHPALSHANDTTHPNLPAYLLSSVEKRLVGFVQDTITSLRYSFYKLGGTTIDTKRGIFIVDCSTYVDHIMKAVYPHSYSMLVNWSGSQKPTSDDYYQYFTNLSGNKLHYWNTVDNVENLRPGDILVFRYKNIRGRETGGHVMIVMDKPIRDKDTFLVRVADSAARGHSKDTRLAHRSGIGIGTLLLKTNMKTLQPYAYAWNIGSRWESNVNFAMARPMSVSQQIN